MKSTHPWRILSNYQLIAVFILVFTLGNSSGFCQEVQKDTLSRDEGFFSTTYKQGAREIKPAEFDSVMRSASDSTIYPRFSNGKTLNTIGDVFGGLGGFGIGFGLGRKPNNTTAIAVGAVAVGIGLVFNIVGNAKMKEAITQYNRLQRDEGAPTSFDLPEPDETIFAISIRF